MFNVELLGIIGEFGMRIKNFLFIFKNKKTFCGQRIFSYVFIKKL